MTAKFDPQKHHRQSIRLKGYDYTLAGEYYVTIVTHGRAFLFGDVVNGVMVLNDAGKIVEAAWFDLPNHYRHVVLGTFVIMPNHVHAIIILMDMDDVHPTIVGAGLKPAPTEPIKRHGLPEIVRALKTFSARRINELSNSRGVPVWQRNYYEHIIRNDDDANRIHQYIESNPANWKNDANNTLK